MVELAAHSIAEESIAASVVSAPPTVVVTAPIGATTSSTVTATWTYASTVPRAQVSARVRLLTETGLFEMYTSGFVAGTHTSFDIPFLLSAGSLYRVEVTVSDGFDFSAPAFSTFLADGTDINDFPDEPAVGSVYEVAINGVGHMLSDSPERPYQRQVGTLNPPRFATTDTPFTEAIERYTMIGQSDWTGGSGQSRANRVDATNERYARSEGVNPFEPGELSLLPETEVQVSDTYTAPRSVVASGQLYVQTDAVELTRLDVPGGTPATAIDFTTPGAIGALASDGTYWYASCADEKIYRGTTTLGSAWCDLSTEAASPPSVVEWCSDRLAVVYANASSQVVLSTLSDAGTEETSGGRFKFTDATIPAVTSGDGYIWFAVNRADRSDIYAWQLGSTDSRFVAFTLPAGQYCTALGFYLGNVMIRAAETVDASTKRAIIYRAFSSSGALTPERVLDFEDEDIDHSAGDFTGDDRFVYWSWEAMADDGRSGIGCLDLSTGGYARWLYAPVDSADGAVTSLFNWNGKVGFSVSGYGAVLEGADPLATGYLDSSVYDLASGVSKVLDDLKLLFRPLPAGGSVAVSLSRDGGDSFVSIGSVATAGLRQGTWDLSSEAPSVAVRVTLGATSVSPKVNVVQTRLHALSLVDEILVLPVNCHDQLRGLNGRDLSGQVRPGMARARSLEALVGSRARIQDVDWPVTRTATIWEVVSAETTSVGVYDGSAGRRAEAQAVCVITLRRPRV